MEGTTFSRGRATASSSGDAERTARISSVSNVRPRGRRCFRVGQGRRNRVVIRKMPKEKGKKQQRRVARQAAIKVGLNKSINKKIGEFGHVFPATLSRRFVHRRFALRGEKRASCPRRSFVAKHW